MKFTKQCSLLLLLVLCFSILFTGCSNEAETSIDAPVDSVVSTAASDVYTEDTELGEGAKTVYVKVVDNNAKTITFTIHTDEKFLGDALVANNIVKGDEGQYGLYITHVNGLEANYDTDKAYWGFYKNGEMMMTGVDSTEFSDGETYELKYVKE